MYVLKKAIAQRIDANGKWQEVDISLMTGRDIASQFNKAFFIIYSKVLDRDITVQLKDYINKLQIYDDTFTQFLEDNKHLSLIEYKDSIEFTDKKYAKYQDAYRAGYKLEASPEIEAIDSEHTIENRPFIKMNKPLVDPNEFYKYCLVSVNGYIHRVDVSDDGIWIMNGMKTVKRSDDNSVGIISFKEVGELEIIPITKEMIYSLVNNHPLYDQCYVDLGVNTDNKTIMLVLGGYIHIMDWLTFRRISLQSIKIDFKNIPLFERYHESMRYLDYSDAPLDKGYDDGGVAVGDLTSDDFIRYYLTTPYSFVVLINNDELYVERLDVTPIPIPGQYISYIRPDMPLINGRGRLVNYKQFKSKRIDRWVVNTKENQYHDYNYLTTTYKDYSGINDSRNTQEPTEYSHSYYLKIGTNIIKK